MPGAVLEELQWAVPQIQLNGWQYPAILQDAGGDGMSGMPLQNFQREPNSRDDLRGVYKGAVPVT
jgi:hypothetical protein